MRQYINLVESLLVEAGVIKNPNRISTRFPTGKRSPENPYTHDLTVDLDSAKRDRKSFEHNVDLVRNYAALPHDQRNNPNHDEVADHFVNHVKDNLLFLHDQMPEEVRNRAKLWYDGANKLAKERAEQYGLSEAQTAAVYAALSPQKAWHENVSCGDRVMDAYLKRQDNGWTDEMEEIATKIWSNDKNKIIHAAIRGKKLAELVDTDHKAAWIRTYDQAHNPADYQIVTPEGGLGRKYTNRDAYGHNTANPEGLATVRWGSLGEIGKAIGALDAGDDLNRISELMGERHKVRNFYNNIVDPNGDYGDVTIDTHAVAGGLLHPLGGNTTEVAHNFDNSLPANAKDAKSFVPAKGTNNTGIRGTYPLYAEAYRRAAAERGIKAREMQSITWEAARGLFNGKGPMKAQHLAQIKTMWKDYQDGKLSADQVRKQISDISGGVTQPDWHLEGKDQPK